MLLSILHRMTGVALSVGLLLLASWVLAVAAGADRFAALDAFVSAGIGKWLMVAWSFALFLHMGNGVRHLFWDVGLGFKLEHAKASGWVVIIFAIVATGAVWLGGVA